MKEDRIWSVLAVNMLLSVFFLPGALEGCMNRIFNITTPMKIEALSGSCLQIPCTYDINQSRLDSNSTINGYWVKMGLGSNRDRVSLDPSRSENRYPLEMIGNMTEQNCTTLFPGLNTSYSDRYYFYIRNGRLIAYCGPIQITVEASPWSPSINIPADLKEHQSVTISCSALTPCPHSPPELTWNLQQDSHRQTENNTEGTFTTKIQETITLSDTHDGYNISCSATYPVNGGSKTAETEVTLSVSYSPWSPSINIPADLKEHQSVTISCSALTPCPHSPPELTWSLQQDSHRQTEKNTEGTFTTKIQETITLSDTHDGYNISCSATYPVNGGNKTAETEVTLSVSYAPRNTSASISPSGLVSAGSWVELSCSSRAKPPASFTWFRNSKHGAINVSVGQVYSFNATEGGEYYCEATNDLGQGTSPVISVSTKDDQVFRFRVLIILTILGIIMMCVTNVIFEW
ncbi:B-cell receptor CD22-like [Fundulus heteroclitus]|uniref:B-cell receptor CD22-like n=1 Tax=Fundulus heteroclitus TaxID=8078 RepID=UPI00165ACA61|nr:B-cell receptor CD22-like [Fundulus heteroclitus]